MENIREGVIIIQPINDFSDEYMVPIDSESFKTPSLTPHTLPNSKMNTSFSKTRNRNSKFEHLLKEKKKRVELQLPNKPFYTPLKTH